MRKTAAQTEVTLHTPTLASIQEAIAEIARNQRAAPKEFRAHPDDYAALCQEMMHIPRGPAQATLFGLDIVLDESAERLPTKGN